MKPYAPTGMMKKGEGEGYNLYCVGGDVKHYSIQSKSSGLVVISQPKFHSHLVVNASVSLLCFIL